MIWAIVFAAGGQQFIREQPGSGRVSNLVSAQSNLRKLDQGPSQTRIECSDTCWGVGTPTWTRQRSWGCNQNVVWAPIETWLASHCNYVVFHSTITNRMAKFSQGRNRLIRSDPDSTEFGPWSMTIGRKFTNFIRKHS